MLSIEDQQAVERRCVDRICIGGCSFRSTSVIQVDAGKLELTLASTGRRAADSRDALRRIVEISCQRKVRDLARIALRAV